MGVEKLSGESYQILAINPGANSTKLGIFQDTLPIAVAKLEHSDQELSPYPRVEDQLSYRRKVVGEWLDQQGFRQKNPAGGKGLSAIVARGGLISPIPGGTYLIDDLMVEHLRQAKNGSHASNLAGLIAQELSRELDIPAYTVDPVVVDELEPVARLSGLAEIERTSKSHALNSKAVARNVASKLGKTYEELRGITVHLGSGISVIAHHQGRMIDVSNAVSGGPYSVERCGNLPGEELVQLCYSGKYSLQEMLKKLYREGGIYSYLGTRDLRLVEARARAGDSQADLILEGMAYQTAKEIGAMATVLEGQLDCIILTGTMAYSKALVDRIFQRIEWIGPVVTVPGEEELEALVAGALRVLQGKEQAKNYELLQLSTDNRSC